MSVDNVEKLTKEGHNQHIFGEPTVIDFFEIYCFLS